MEGEFPIFQLEGRVPSPGGDEDVAAPKPFPFGAVSRWANSGSGSGSSPSPSSGSNRRLHFAFDSDGDADPDTDAWGKGSRPGSSSFLAVADLRGLRPGPLFCDASGTFQDREALNLEKAVGTTDRTDHTDKE